MYKIVPFFGTIHGNDRLLSTLSPRDKPGVMHEPDTEATDSRDGTWDIVWRGNTWRSAERRIIGRERM